MSLAHSTSGELPSGVPAPCNSVFLSTPNALTTLPPLGGHSGSGVRRLFLREHGCESGQGRAVLLEGRYADLTPFPGAGLCL